MERRRHSKTSSVLEETEDIYMSLFSEYESTQSEVGFTEEREKRSGKRQRFACKECGKVFDGSSHLSRHMAAHERQKKANEELRATMEHRAKISYKCHKCNESFEDGKKLIKHFETHSMHRMSYNCLKCKKTFEDRSKLNEHIETHDTYMCSICNTKFPLKNALMKHMDQHKESVHFSCVVCGFVFYCEGEIASQMKFSGDEIKCSQCALACGICKRFFSKKKSLMSHMEMHKEVSFVCTECGEKFKSRLEISSHMKDHMFKCSKCTQFFTNTFSLRQHQQTTHAYSEVKAFFCDICGKRFDAISVMVQHKKLHLDKFRFSCPVCGHTFPVLSDLVDHVKTHRNTSTGVQSSLKGHVKIHSNASTGVKSNLTNHVKIHTSEGTEPPRSIIYGVKSAAKSPEPTQVHPGTNPIVCYSCGKTFSMKTDLVDHVEETHSMKEQFSCGVCDQVFSKRKHVMDHMNIHRGENEHSRTKCDKSFVLKHQLLSEELVHTPKSECCSTGALKKGAIVTAGHQKVNGYICSVCDGTFTHEHVTVLNLRTMLCLPSDMPKSKRRKKELVIADITEEENEHVRLDVLEDMKDNDEMVFCNTCLVSGNVCCCLCGEQKNVCELRSHIGLHTGEILS